MLDDPGEKELFEKLYHKYHILIGKIALHITHDELLAFDAANNTLTAIAKSIKSIPPSTDEIYERAYICNIAKNMSYNYLRDVKKRQNLVEFNPNIEYMQGENPADRLISKDEHTRIVDYIESMSDTYKDILIFKYVYDMNAKEISTALQIPINTVKTKIRRGTKLLQDFIEGGVTV